MRIIDNRGVTKMTDRGSFIFPNPIHKMHFGGERYVSGMIGSIQHEHYHRYLFAADFCRGRRVLDIACGEGYGCSILGQVAEHVVGVDIDRQTIVNAEKTYGAASVRFLVADATQIPLADQRGPLDGTHRFRKP